MSFAICREEEEVIRFYIQSQIRLLILLPSITWTFYDHVVHRLGKHYNFKKKKKQAETNSEENVPSPFSVHYAWNSCLKATIMGLEEKSIKENQGKLNKNVFVENSLGTELTYARKRWNLGVKI